MVGVRVRGAVGGCWSWIWWGSQQSGGDLDNLTLGQMAEAEWKGLWKWSCQMILQKWTWGQQTLVRCQKCLEMLWNGKGGHPLTAVTSVSSYSHLCSEAGTIRPNMMSLATFVACSIHSGILPIQWPWQWPLLLAWSYQSTSWLSSAFLRLWHVISTWHWSAL